MSKPDKVLQSIDATFTATVVADDNSGWPCVRMPDSAAFFGTGKAVKVGGTIDGHEYEATMLPVGGATHMLPLRAQLRKLLGTELGDQVTVHLTRRFT